MCGGSDGPDHSVMSRSLFLLQTQRGGNPKNAQEENVSVLSWNKNQVASDFSSTQWIPKDDEVTHGVLKKTLACGHIWEQKDGLRRMGARNGTIKVPWKNIKVPRYVLYSRGKSKLRGSGGRVVPPPGIPATRPEQCQASPPALLRPVCPFPSPRKYICTSHESYT